jgi:hypothetical protein
MINVSTSSLVGAFMFRFARVVQLFVTKAKEKKILKGIELGTLDPKHATGHRAE